MSGSSAGAMGRLGLAAADDMRPMRPAAAQPVIAAFDPQKVAIRAQTYIAAAT